MKTKPHPRYRLIVLDWDGTVMDSGDKIANCFRAAAREAGFPEPEPDAVKRYIGTSLSTMCRALYPGTAPAQAAQVVEGYRKYWNHLDRTPVQLYPGVQTGLHALAEAGFLLAIATGKSREGLDRVLDRTNLRPWFVYSRCADESRPKPHPKMLLDILAYTGMAVTESLMIGDTTFDLRMAKAAGMDGLGIGHGYHSKEELESCGNLPVAGNFPELTAWLLDPGRTGTGQASCRTNLRE